MTPTVAWGIALVCFAAGLTIPCTMMIARPWHYSPALIWAAGLFTILVACVGIILLLS